MNDVKGSINVAIPIDAHRQMKQEARIRGMSLREYQRYLLKLAAVAPDDVHGQAYAGIVRERRDAIAAHASG